MRHKKTGSPYRDRLTSIQDKEVIGIGIGRAALSLHGIRRSTKVDETDVIALGSELRSSLYQYGYT